jgi:hypothetical protein
MGFDSLEEPIHFSWLDMDNNVEEYFFSAAHSKSLTTEGLILKRVIVVNSGITSLKSPGYIATIY